MDIEITTYRPAYLEQQVAIGKKIRADWPLGTQPQLDQLKKVYESPGFDPETNFYAL